jgi:hypothetical protein
MSAASQFRSYTVNVAIFFPYTRTGGLPTGRPACAWLRACVLVLLNSSRNSGYGVRARRGEPGFPYHRGVPEDRPTERHLSKTIAITESITISSRHYMAAQHLWSARHQARLCAEIESAGRGDIPVFDIEHRAYSVGAVLASVTFLEALVNEVFQDAADSIDGNVNTRVAPLGESAVALMGQFRDASEQGGRYVGVLEKFQMALLFAGKPKLEAGAYPYQDAKLLISIRNDLVHFRPVTQTHDEEMAREKQLKGKFAENALMLGAGNPWFPAKCLGAGCAHGPGKLVERWRTNGRSGWCGSRL